MKKLRAQYKALQLISYVNGAPNKEYWQAHEAFQEALRGFLVTCTNLYALNKPDLFLLIAWVNTFRPIAPHTFLSRLSQDGQKFSTTFV